MRDIGRRFEEASLFPVPVGVLTRNGPPIGGAFSLCGISHGMEIIQSLLGAHVGELSAEQYDLS